MKHLLAALVLTLPLAGFAQATTPPAAPTLDTQRCATKVAIALTGRSADAALLANPNPQAQVDQLLQGTAFIERFSRYVNARFNDEPGATPVEDAAYHLARHVLTNRLPWSDLFLGPFRVDTVNNQVQVVNDPNGLGYLRSPAWLRRYAGNEEDGVKLNTAYRILNNTTGITLTAAVVVPGLDTSANGRRNAACSACHYDSWFALDTVASVLTKRVGTGAQMRFEPPTGGPTAVLNGVQVSDDKGLVTALVHSTDFEFNVCRLAFGFVHGRKELACEGPLFDRCVDAFRAQRTMQAAVATLVKDPSYCR
jgi:hypothetical protein